VDKYRLEAHLKELINRTLRLRESAKRQNVNNNGQRDLLLFETTDCLADLAEVTVGLHDELMKISEQFGIGHDSHQDDDEHDDVHMLCPNCHNALSLRRPR